ncbi:hypothetical protein [Paraflavitalea sp. CAU 1676]|uniref:hypothetical protein n=1 Tax=Paraflavitalea sp. CAU 1676 TaxID=3032598 RepID=UPI0023DC1BC3|nr:hypothetical protein [Paraflavitalea sp. CAU 1676]MDF2191360.1 hypothetical protein [Paraflavitalea sp. CAU 1676]
MDPRNYQTLKEEVLPRMGFGGVFDDQLQPAMQQGKPEFSLQVPASFGTDKMNYELVFQKNKKDTNDQRYYLNEVKVVLEKPEAPKKEYTFQLFNQTGFNASQMYNAMDGRYVHSEFRGKSNNQVSVWTTIQETQKEGKIVTSDRRVYENSSNFNLVKAMSALPLAAMSQEQKENALQNMRDGHKASVIIKTDTGRESVTLVAQPHVGEIAVFNLKGERLHLDKANVQGVAPVFELPPLTKSLVEAADKKDKTQEQKQGTKVR